VRSIHASVKQGVKKRALYGQWFSYCILCILILNHEESG
jgi:hypothetical protein